MVVANVLYEKSVVLKYSRIEYDGTSRNGRKIVANDDLTLQTNYNKSFLNWHFS